MRKIRKHSSKPLLNSRDPCHGRKTHHVELFLAEKAVLVLVKLSERQLYLVELLAALQRKYKERIEQVKCDRLSILKGEVRAEPITENNKFPIPCDSSNFD